MICIAVVSIVNATTRNYYWNTSFEFPATDEEFLAGRAHLALEAIRKHIFLLEYPAAGYYKEDEPQVRLTTTGFVANVDSSGELLGSLYVLRGDTVYYVVDGNVQSYPYHDPNIPYLTDPVGTFINQFGTRYQYQAATFGHVHRQGEVQIYCDGVIYTNSNGTMRLPITVGAHIFLPTTPPQSGGWFADNAVSGWRKTPSRNIYAQWDNNTFRRIVGGELEGTTGFDDVIQDWNYDAWKQLPKQFDPYQQDRVLYRLTAQYLDEGKLLHYGKDSLVLNKYYAKDKTQLWKCLNPDTENEPSINYPADWEYVNLWQVETLRSLDFRYWAESVPIDKEHFYVEDIQGAVFGSQGNNFTNPIWNRTQYRINTVSLPVGCGAGEAIYPEDPKMTAAIMAYIERLFDRNIFAVPVDSEFKANYHNLVGGIYGLTQYDSFDDAVNAGKISPIQSIKHRAWGCNESGFEWVLRKVGDYVWYFDTVNPYFPNYDFYPWDNIGSNDQREELQAAFNQFIGNIRGTWRRTWKHSFGVPQEVAKLRDGSYIPQKKGLFRGGYMDDPNGVMEQWYEQGYINSDTYDFTHNLGISSYPISHSSEIPGDPNTRALFEPDWQFYDVATGKTIRRWSIDRITKIVNHIWDVLTVDLGYHGQYTGLGIAGAFFADEVNFYNPTHENLLSSMRAAIAQHKTQSYGSTNSFGNYTDNWNTIDGVDQGNIRCNLARFTINSISGKDNTTLVLTPNSNLSILLRTREGLYDPGWELLFLTEDASGIPASASLSFLSGDPIVGLSTPAPTVLESGFIDSQLGKDIWYGQATYSDWATRELTFPYEALVGNGLVGYYVLQPLPPFGTNIATRDQLRNNPNPIKSINGGNSMLVYATSYNDAIYRYDWNRVPINVWFADGNHPVLVESFDLPLRPPYPNPVSWINPPMLRTIYRQNRSEGEHFELINLKGNVSNAMSNPAGRDIDYIFWLDTLSDLGGVEAYDEWDSETTYYVDDEVVYYDQVYRANTTTTGDRPPATVSFGTWTLIKYNLGWQNLVWGNPTGDPNSTDGSVGFEYVVSEDNPQHYILQNIDRTPQEDVHFDLLMRREPFSFYQDLVWYHNFCHWQAYCKAYDDGGTGEQLIYTHGDPNYILTAVAEIIVPETSGLELGAFVDYTANTIADPNDPNEVIIVSYDLAYRWKWGDRYVDGVKLIDYTFGTWIPAYGGHYGYNYDTAKIMYCDIGDPNDACQMEDWIVATGLTDDNMLDRLCNYSNYGYEPTSLAWNDWGFDWSFVSSDGEDLPTNITPESEDLYTEQKFRAIVEMTIGDVTHQFYSGWVSVLPAGRLGWN